jgi:hypothetical protein
MPSVHRLRDLLYQKINRFSWQPRVKEMKSRAQRALRNLHAVQDSTHLIKPGDRLLMTMGRDENTRIPYFLDYYRRLGIDHFLFVDNRSETPMAEVLLGHADISLWTTNEAYEDTRYGVDWMNALLGKYAVGHWALTVDLDEFFVYPYMGQRSYGELLAFLDDSEKQSFHTLMVDMYPENSIATAHVPPGENPLLHAPYFDCAGYYAINGWLGETYVRGGPRLRAFNASNYEEAPAVQKTPLVKWQHRFAYYLSTHVICPKFLNQAHKQYPYPTGVLLHYKFVSSFQEKIDYAIKHKNHYNGSVEYQKYLSKLKTSEEYTLFSAVSKKFEGPESLIQGNLMTAGCWK